MDTSPDTTVASTAPRRAPELVAGVQVCHVAVYGAGEALGVTALHAPEGEALRWLCSARAVGRALVIEASVPHARQLSELHPAVGDCFETMLRQQANDTIIADALQQLQVRKVPGGRGGEWAGRARSRSQLSGPPPALPAQVRTIEHEATPSFREGAWSTASNHASR